MLDLDTTVHKINETETHIMHGQQVVATVRCDAPNRYSIVVATGYSMFFKTVEISKDPEGAPDDARP